MKKPSSKIREEIARLQDQLRAAETREAERIGRIALKAGLGEIQTDEAEFQAAFEDIARRFRKDKGPTTGRENGRGTIRDRGPSPPLEPSTDASGLSEA
jgi:hypothetical protein